MLDILYIAEQNILASTLVVLSIGLVQGAVLGRGIRKRFPKLRVHARIVSGVLLVLFTINAISNTLMFANPEKLSVFDMTIPVTVDQGIEFAINVLGLNTGFGTVLALFVSVTLVLMFRQAQLPRIARYFVFVLGVIMLCVAVLGRFTDYIPTFFEVVIYATYQFGITIGIFVVTYRKEQV